MASTHTRDILLFAGQGSNQHLANPAAVNDLQQLLGEEQLLSFQSFLRRCRDAFHVEVQSAKADEADILGPDILEVFDNPRTLLIPPPAYHSHPLFETITLYLHQVLELMLFQSHQDTHHVIETAGVCAGILPAVVAASYSSYDSEAFISSAVETFRLAFWVGLRAALHSRKICGDEFRDTPSVLSVFGVSAETLEEKLAGLDDKSSEERSIRVRTSAIFNDGNSSLSGEGSQLADIKSSLANESIQSRWAHVHAFYHGGDDLEETLSLTLGDVERRRIQFPEWESLQVPLRSAADGVRRDSELNSKRYNLLETALRSIFVEKVDWRNSAAHLQAALESLIARDSAAKLRVLGMGPGSKSLVATLKDLQSSNLETVDNWAEQLTAPSPDDIAIVGLSVNYPDSKGLDQFWETMESRRCTAREIPTDRFDIKKTKNASANVKYGNFLNEPFDFDAAYFNISPREAKVIDPQQRLLLNGALDALEDAGYSPNSTPTFQKETFGVYVGVATGDYVDNLRDNIDVYYSPGTLRAFLAGRISYAFKFKGPSMVLDTACSGSLVALDRACRALQAGECTAALAGGVNVITSPDMYLGLGRAHFLSPTGQCKPFDELADGYCRAEGCGLVVVKKLSQAIEEGDHIYGIVRGIGLNQCGTAKSITHPEASTQAELVRSVLKTSRVTPDSINVVEAHGTGTQAGDYAEVSSLRAVFGERSTANPLWLSSIKGNFGHAEAASGVAGLAKLLLMMDRKKIPPQASHSVVNPRLKKGLADTILIPTQMEDWGKGAGITTRRALLNNFGASGSNAALVVEEYIPSNHRNPKEAKQPRESLSHNILNLSAKTEKALDTLKGSHIEYLKKYPETRLEDLCYSANARRQELLPYKASIIATNAKDMLERLAAMSTSDKSVKKQGEKKTVFAFSGQGAVHKGMGSALLTTAPVFQQVVEECDTVLTENGFPSVFHFLQGTSGELSADEEVVISQCACFVVEYALARLWISWGIIPDLVVGHSIGEYAAFATAGALKATDALLLVARRAMLMVTQCQAKHTGMMLCRLSSAEVEKVVNDQSGKFSGISVSCMNGPQDFVLGGPLESLNNFSDYCKEEGFKCKALPVPYGFHSCAMDPMLKDLEKLAASVPTLPPQYQMGSSLHGKVLPKDVSLEPDYFVRHAREPVNFTGLVQDISEWLDDCELNVIEAGPSPSTEGMFKNTMAPTPITFMASLKPNQPAWATLSNSLQSLFWQGQKINWRSLYSGTGAKFLRSLPRYPLSMSSYFIPYKPILDSAEEPSKEIEVQQPKFAFLTANPPTVTEDAKVFSTALKQIGRFIKAHTVGGLPLCPASVYLEIAVQATADQGSLEPENMVCLFDDVAFDHPLVHTEEAEARGDIGVHTHLSEGQLSGITNFASKSNTGQTFCTGSIRALPKAKQNVADLLSRKLAKTQRLKRSFPWESRNFTETFSTRTIYDIIFPRVVEYSDPFLTLQHLTVSSSGLEGHGTFRMVPTGSALGGRFVSSPVLVDTLLHAAGFIANTHVSPDIACICVSLDQAMMPGDTAELYDQDLQVYCTLGDIEHSLVADAYAITSDNKVVAYVEGMCFKKIKLKSFRAHLSRVAGVAPVNKAPPTAAAPPPAAKQAAPKPATKEAPRKSRADSGDMTNTICTIVKDICGADFQPTPAIALAELGVDSLLLIELTETLRKRFPQATIEREAVEECQTVGDMIKLVGVVDAPEDEGEAEAEAEAETEAPTTKATATPSLITDSASTVGSSTGTSTPDTMIADIGPQIKNIFVEVCGVDPSGEKDQALSNLGVDSLMSIELSHELKGKLGIMFDPESENMSELTYQQLEDLCASKLPGPAADSTPPSSVATPARESSPVKTSTLPVPEEPIVNKRNQPGVLPKVLQTSSGPGRPLYMFHDGSGLCSMYARLTDMRRNFYGICSVDSPMDEPVDQSATTMEELAASYIDRADLMAQSDIILGGWSFGGVLAFEVSRQLSKRGKNPRGVILVDSPVPIKHQALPAEVISYVTSRGPGGNNRAVSPAVQKARETINGQFKRHAGMLQNYQPKMADPKHNEVDVPIVILRCVETLDTKSLCGVEYPWLSDSKFSKETVKQWEKLTGRRIPVLEIECAHFDVFESANVEGVSNMLQMACEYLDHNA